MNPIVRLYCEDCGWSTRRDPAADGEATRRAVDHHVRTGHTIDSERASDARRSADRLDRDGSDDERDPGVTDGEDWALDGDWSVDW